MVRTIFFLEILQKNGVFFILSVKIIKIKYSNENKYWTSILEYIFKFSKFYTLNRNIYAKNILI